MEEASSLRILVTDGIGEQLEVSTRTVVGLGHEVIARESSLPEVARLTASERPDVALVIVSQGTIHALEMIDQIVHEAGMSGRRDPARSGPRFHHGGGQARDLRLRRGRGRPRGASERHRCGAQALRRVPQPGRRVRPARRHRRAKGILMERHGVDEEAAFNLLRDHARRKQAKLVDIAEAVVAGHPLLPSKRQSPE